MKRAKSASISAGCGSLSATTGTSVTYTPPTTSCTDAVTVSTSVNPNVLKTFRITVNGPPTLSLNCPQVTYDGNAHTCAGLATGVGGAAVSGSWSFNPAGETNVGSYAVTGTFTSGDPNYANGSASGTLVINPKSPTLTLSCPTVAYDGNTHGCTGTATGVSGAVAGSWSYSPVNGTAVGSYAVTGTFTSSDPNYAGGSASGTLIINLKSPTLALSCPTVTYDGNAHGCTGTATGASGAIAGSWSYSPASEMAVGGYPVTGTFTSSDPDYGSGSATGTLTISAVNPALNLALQSGSPAQPPYGTNLEFVLSMASSVVCPTGTVSFFVDGGSQPASTTTLNGASCTMPTESALFETSSLASGTHTITATYSGDANYQSANTNANPLSETVHADSTGVSLAASATSANASDPITFTATIAPATVNGSFAEAPSGTVNFNQVDGQGNLVGTLNSSPIALTATAPYTASFTTSSLAAGTTNVLAVFSDADGNFSGSSTSVAVETVSLRAPVICWNSGCTTPNVSISYGAALSSALFGLNATDPENGAPVAGSFTVLGAGTVPGSGSPLVQVNFTPSNTAEYSSQTASTSITVTPATLTVQANNETMLYAGVIPALQFQYGGFVNGDSATVVTTAPVCSTAATSVSAPGVYPIICSGGAAANYSFSYVSGSLTIAPDGSALSVVSGTNPVTAGSSVTFTATLAGGANGETITFNDGGNPIGTGTLNNNVATLTIATLSAGSHTITASYAGDTDYSAGVSPAITETVNAPTLTLSASPQGAVGEAAQVSITASTNDTQGVSWTVSGNNCGSLLSPSSNSVSFKAPNSVAAACTATVTATSKSDSAVTSSVSIPVNLITIGVSAGATSIAAADNNQTSTTNLSATLTNDAANGGVTWSVNNNCGTISPSSSASGAIVTFTAINAKVNNLASACAATVTATSATDSTKTATQLITVNPPSATLTTTGSLNLLAGAGGQSLTATLTSLASSATPSLTWSISPATGCGTINNTSTTTSPVNGTYTPPSTLSASCTATVSVKYNQNNYYEASLTFSVSPVPTLSVSASPQGAVGEDAQVNITATTTDPQGVAWTISPSSGACGSLSSTGTTSVAYTSPAPLSSACTATITGTSKTDPAVTSYVTITANPLTVNASATSTNIFAGASMSVSSTVTNDGASAGVNWSISPANGSCGTVTGGGTSVTYSAPASISTSCTATVTATSVTDSTQSSSVQITAVPVLAIGPQNVAPGEVWVPGVSGVNSPTYAQTFTALNGTGPYTWTIGGNLPPGVTVSTVNTNELIGSPTAAGQYNITVQVTDTTTLQTASANYTIHIGTNNASNTGLVYGSYTCYYQGHKDDGTAEAMVWDMKLNCTTAADGSCSAGGYIKGGVVDFNSTSGSTTLASPATITASSVCSSGSCYTLGSDMRGILQFGYTGSSVNTFAISVGNWQSLQAQQQQRNLASELRLTRIDDVGDGSSGYTASGRYGAGECFRDAQSLVSSGNAASAITGINWVFGLSGANSSNQPEAAGGVLTYSWRHEHGVRDCYCRHCFQRSDGSGVWQDRNSRNRL